MRRLTLKHIAGLMLLAVIIWLLVLVTAARGQGVTITEHLPGALPAGASYGCRVTEDRHFFETLDVKTKKVTRTPLPSEFMMRLFVEKDGHETWSFEPGPYAEEDDALQDCKRWRAVVRKSLEDSHAKPKN